MSCGVGCRHGSDVALLWLWCRLAATALIRPPYATGVTLEKEKRLKKKKKKKVSFLHLFPAAQGWNIGSSKISNQRNAYPCWICFVLFCLFRATPVYGGSQARGLIGAVASSPHHSHSNPRSEPPLQPSPQLTTQHRILNLQSKARDETCVLMDPS